VTWTIKVSSKAEHYYMRLDKDLRSRIKKELAGLAELNNPLEHQNVKHLTGELKGFHRLRIGDYRIVFHVFPDIHTIAVVNIAPRGGVYK
jgi:mRNA interferase RelE/StbE